MSCDGDVFNVPAPGDVLPDVLVVVVTSRRTGHTTRRALFNLPSAVRAVERARARGDRAYMRLCQLVPAPALPVPRGLDQPEGEGTLW